MQHKGNMVFDERREIAKNRVTCQLPNLEAAGSNPAGVTTN
jgi:hypothetical protein